MVRPAGLPRHSMCMPRPLLPARAWPRSSTCTLHLLRLANNRARIWPRKSRNPPGDIDAEPLAASSPAMPRLLHKCNALHQTPVSELLASTPPRHPPSAPSLPTLTFLTLSPAIFGRLPPLWLHHLSRYERTRTKATYRDEPRPRQTSASMPLLHCLRLLTEMIPSLQSVPPSLPPFAKARLPAMLRVLLPSISPPSLTRI